MFFPMEALSVERVPATEVLHVYKPIRAGQFRGQPWLTSVIAKLYELEQYTDAEIVRKKLAAMITGFITQASPDNPIIPPDQYQNGPGQTEPGTQISKLEPGTFQVLNFGEEVSVRRGQGQRRFQIVHPDVPAGFFERRRACRVSDQRRPVGDQLLFDPRRPAGVPPQVRAVSAFGFHLPGLPPGL